MLSHEVMPAIFKIDTKYLGFSTLKLYTKGMHYPSNSCVDKPSFIALNLKLLIANKELALNSVLVLHGEKSKIQLQLLEDELLGDDGFDFSDCENIEIEERYLGRTDEQIDEIEKDLIHAEMNNGESFFLSGSVINPIDEPFLTIDEAFSQPIFLDTSWQDVYNLNYQKTDNSIESASQTKELYFKIENSLNEWLVSQFKFS